MVTVVAVSWNDGAIRAPAVAVGCVLAVAGVAGWSTHAVRHDPGALTTGRFVLVEATLALGLSMLDGLVFDPGHVFETSQSLATQYPLLAMASIGFAAGPRVAASVGVLMGPAEGVGAVLNEFDDWAPRHIVSLAATSLFFGLVGAVTGWLADQLRATEAEIADRRARDEVGRVLHDTVLQTLAVVERRTAEHDPELAAAARDADRDLRRFLYGTPTGADSTLGEQVREAVDRAARHVDLDVIVNVIDDGSAASDADRQALVGAIGEAVANAAKHADASRVVVFVDGDHDGGLFASVRDDGVGFDVDTTAEGTGIERSIKARMADVGGRVDLWSSPGTGTEVRLWTT